MNQLIHNKSKIFYSGLSSCCQSKDQ